QISQLEHVGARAACAGGGLAGTQLHAGQELLEAEGLGDVVVRAALEPLHRVVHAGAGGDHEDRDLRVHLPQRPEHLEAVHAGQAHVEDEQVEVPAGGEIEGGDAVLDHGGGEAVRLQTALHEARDARLVLGDEDPHPSFLLGAVRSSASAGSGPRAPVSPAPPAAATPASARCSGSADGDCVNWGNTIVKVDPRPGSERRRTAPPCPSAIDATIGRPSPEPDSRPPSTRVKRSKMRRWSSGAMPRPSSCTVTWISGPSAPSTRSTPKRMRLPSSL